jgi:hypothetical protein
MSKATRLCILSIEQLNALSARLGEMQDVARNPAYCADLQQARFAIADLSSSRFGIKEIADKLHDYADEKLCDYGEIHTAILVFMDDLDSLLGEGVGDRP